MIFFEHSYIDKDNKVAEFSALENNKISGSCTLVLTDKYAEITKLDYAENCAYIVEGLLKAAFNLAGLRGYYMGRCSVDNIEFCLKRLNFTKTENGYENDIPSILMGSCAGCQNNS